MVLGGNPRVDRANNVARHTYGAPTGDASGGYVTSRGQGPNAGSLTTTTLGYSPEGLTNSVTTASGTTNYVRDYRGLRIEKAGAGGAGWFSFDQRGELIGWQGPATTTTLSGCRKVVVPHETFLWLDGRPIAVIKTHTQTGSCTGNGFYVDDVFFYFTDKMGLPRAVSKLIPLTGVLTTVWGPATWDAFGNPLTTINENPDGDTQTFTVPFRLPGQFALGTLEGGPSTSSGGLHDNWFRVYDSTTGRYLQPDPVMALSPERFGEPYTYARNSPFGLTDRSGTVAVPLVVVGAPVGAGTVALVASGALALTAGVFICVSTTVCSDALDWPRDEPIAPPIGPLPWPNLPDPDDDFPWEEQLPEPKPPTKPLGPDIVCELQPTIPRVPKKPKDCAKKAESLEDCWKCCTDNFAGWLPTGSRTKMTNCMYACESLRPGGPLQP